MSAASDRGRKKTSSSADIWRAEPDTGEGTRNPGVLSRMDGPEIIVVRVFSGDCEPRPHPSCEAEPGKRLGVRVDTASPSAITPRSGRRVSWRSAIVWEYVRCSQ